MIGVILVLTLVVLIVVLSFLIPVHVMEEEPRKRKARRKSDPISDAIRRLGS